jgi:hypothetical protein
LKLYLFNQHLTMASATAAQESQLRVDILALRAQVADAQKRTLAATAVEAEAVRRADGVHDELAVLHERAAQVRRSIAELQEEDIAGDAALVREDRLRKLDQLAALKDELARQGEASAREGVESKRAAQLLEDTAAKLQLVTENRVALHAQLSTRQAQLTHMTGTADSTRASMSAAEAKRDELASTLEHYLEHLSSSSGRGAAGYGSSRDVPRCLHEAHRHQQHTEGGSAEVDTFVYPGLKHDWQTLGSRDLAQAILNQLLAAERKILSLDAQANAKDAALNVS